MRFRCRHESHPPKRCQKKVPEYDNIVSTRPHPPDGYKKLSNHVLVCVCVSVVSSQAACTAWCIIKQLATPVEPTTHSISPTRAPGAPPRSIAGSLDLGLRGTAALLRLLLLCFQSLALGGAANPGMFNVRKVDRC